MIVYTELRNTHPRELIETKLWREKNIRGKLAAIQKTYRQMLICAIYLDYEAGN